MKRQQSSIEEDISNFKSMEAEIGTNNPAYLNSKQHMRVRRAFYEKIIAKYGKPKTEKERDQLRWYKAANKFNNRQITPNPWKRIPKNLIRKGAKGAWKYGAMALTAAGAMLTLGWNRLRGEGGQPGDDAGFGLSNSPADRANGNAVSQIGGDVQQKVSRAAEPVTRKVRTGINNATGKIGIRNNRRSPRLGRGI